MQRDGGVRKQRRERIGEQSKDCVEEQKKEEKKGDDREESRVEERKIEMHIKGRNHEGRKEEMNTRKGREMKRKESKG